MNRVVFAGGCFWGVESCFYDLKGVSTTQVGYMGGNLKNPTYKDVCKNNTGHAEVVLVEFDETLISLNDLLRIFFKSHNSSALSKAKEQYRSAIFFYNEKQRLEIQEYIDKLKLTKTINTQVEEAFIFYLAEERHQQYYKKHKRRK